MLRRTFLLTLAIVLAGCSGGQGGADRHVAALEDARVDHQRAAGVAYEHAITLEIAAGQARQVADAVRQACAALPKRGCTLLEASLRSGENAGATIRMRVMPDGVNQVLGALDGRGKVVSQSTTGEDLAEPIVDGERKAAMLAGYRDKLQALAGQRALDADALIKLHRELAEVQSEIEKAADAQAQLRRRVDTELLTVSLDEHAKGGKASRVVRALEDFGDDLLQGVALLITFVASTIPFALFGAVGFAVWRRMRARRRKGRAEEKAAPGER